VSVNITNTVKISGLDAICSLYGFPQTCLWRTEGLDEVLLNGTPAEGAVVPSSVYKFVLRVAKPLGAFTAGYSSRNFHMNANA